MITEIKTYRRMHLIFFKQIKSKIGNTIKFVANNMILQTEQYVSKAAANNQSKHM